MLYELTTLKHAVDAGNMHALVLKIMRGKYAPPPTIFSEELRGLIADMLNRDPSKRPSINEVLKRPVMQNRIRQFLSESVARSEFSHTVLHGQKPMVSLGPGQRIAPAPEPERVRPAAMDAAAARNLATQDRAARGGGAAGYQPPRSGQARRPTSRQQAYSQPDQEGLLTMEAKKVADAQRARREQRAAAYKEAQAQRPAAQQSRAEGGGARPHGLAAARDREEHMRRIKQQQRENEQALQALAQQGRPVASAQAPYGRAGVRGPSRGGVGVGGVGVGGGVGGGGGHRPYEDRDYQPSGAALYGHGGERVRIQQAKAREAELREYTRQNALDARRQAEANKQRALESERAEQRAQRDASAAGGGGGAFDATPVDQMMHPMHQESPPWQPPAPVTDEYAEEGPRERMLRQKRERQDAERRAHEEQLAEARRQHYEEMKRIAAKRSPVATRSGVAAQADDDTARAAAIAAAKEKEAAWRAKQQQALDAVGGQDRLPGISPSPVRSGDLAPDQFEVKEGHYANGGGGQHFPHAVETSADARGAEQDFAEPEPYGYGSAYGEVDTAETFDDYDTIVANEVVEEEVLVRNIAINLALPTTADSLTGSTALMAYCAMLHFGFMTCFSWIPCRHNVKGSSTRCATSWPVCLWNQAMRGHLHILRRTFLWLTFLLRGNLTQLGLIQADAIR